MDIFQASVLGVVQGLTEFLPVSSSGHLVLANYFFGWGAEGESLPLEVDIFTNTGTFLAVLVALRKDVWLALSGFLRGLVSAQARQEEGWRLALLVIAGSIPTAVIGLGLEPVFEALNRPLYVSFALIITGILLWFTPKSGEKETAKELSWRDAVIGGIAQGLAVIPGISRAGITIVTMLWRGASSDLAPRFSFMMYLVVSFGVMLKGILEIEENSLGFDAIISMTISSFVVGYIALIWLFAVLRRGQFKWFSPYVWAIAVITLLSLWL